MPEEDEGFTFVDKRRVQAETTAEETPAPAATEPQPTAAEDLETDAAAGLSDDDLDDGAPPDTYSLLGYCISLLASDAWQKLGLLADPRSGQAQPDLAQAKVAIDAVGDLASRLEAAPREAVPDSLRRDLRTLLNDLRLNYVAQQGQGR